MNIKSFLLAAIVCLCSLSTLSAQDHRSISPRRTTPYWQDVNVVQVNKEHPRTQFMTYETRSEALNIPFEESKYYLSLNGTWKFYFVDSLQTTARTCHRFYRRPHRMERYQGTGQLGNARFRYCDLCESPLRIRRT